MQTNFVRCLWKIGKENYNCFTKTLTCAFDCFQLVVFYIQKLPVLSTKYFRDLHPLLLKWLFKQFWLKCKWYCYCWISLNSVNFSFEPFLFTSPPFASVRFFFFVRQNVPCFFLTLHFNFIDILLMSVDIYVICMNVWCKQIYYLIVGKFDIFSAVVGSCWYSC